MKVIGKLVFLICLFAASFGFVGDSGAIKGKIKSGVLQLGKAQFKGEWQLDELINAIGTDYRKRDGYNTTYTYDEKGIVLFNPKDTKIVSEVQFYFTKPAETNNVMSTGLFTGEMKVDKLKVRADLTSAEMKKKLKKWADSDSYMEHNYRKELNGVYIYFLFNDAETTLIKMSVGVAKKK
ncbi:MAG TPA: hypothetical protein VGF30_09655 [Bacteroidia bacterium]